MAKGLPYLYDTTDRLVEHDFPYALKINNIYPSIPASFIIDFSDTIRNNTSHVQIMNDYAHNSLSWYDSMKDIFPYISIYFMEIGTIDLHKFLKMRCETKSIQLNEMLEILFQVAYTLSVIQYHIPHFRHNDLKSNNLIVKINRDDMKRDFNHYTSYTQYSHGDKTFYIPNRGYTIKIIDFDFSYSKKYQNQKILNWEDTNFRTLGYGPFVNPVFDLHFFLNSLYQELFILISSVFSNFISCTFFKFSSVPISICTPSLFHTAIFPKK